MLRRHLAKLLFCIALLAQIAASLVGAVAMADARAGRGAGICDPSLAAHARTAASTANCEKSPLGKSCSSCHLRVLSPRRGRAARLGDSLDGPASNGLVPLRPARLGREFHPRDIKAWGRSARAAFPSLNAQSPQSVKRRPQAALRHAPRKTLASREGLFSCFVIICCAASPPAPSLCCAFPTDRAPRRSPGGAAGHRH